MFPHKKEESKATTMTGTKDCYVIKDSTCVWWSGEGAHDDEYDYVLREVHLSVPSRLAPGQVCRRARFVVDASGVCWPEWVENHTIYDDELRACQLKRVLFDGAGFAVQDV